MNEGLKVLEQHEGGVINDRMFYVWQNYPFHGTIDNLVKLALHLNLPMYQDFSTLSFEVTLLVEFSCRNPTQRVCNFGSSIGLIYILEPYMIGWYTHSHLLISYASCKKDKFLGAI